MGGTAVACLGIARFFGGHFSEGPRHSTANRALGPSLRRHIKCGGMIHAPLKSVPRSVYSTQRLSSDVMERNQLLLSVVAVKWLLSSAGGAANHGHDCRFCLSRHLRFESPHWTVTLHSSNGRMSGSESNKYEKHSSRCGGRYRSPGFPLLSNWTGRPMPKAELFFDKFRASGMLR